MNLLVFVVWASIVASLITADYTTLDTHVFTWKMTEKKKEYEKEESGYFEVDEETERIVGGSDAVAGQFPYAAALYLNDKLCTASIISPTTVMTAAHCVPENVESQPADRFYLIANVNRMAQSVRIEVANVISHPEYDKNSFENDIAILKTVKEIEFSDEVGPVCIAGPNTEQMQYKNATAIGWGNMTRIVFQNLSETLQHVKQGIVPNIVCNFTFPGIKESQLCATGFLRGICEGDSGGPLVHLSADKPPVQIGVTSLGNDWSGCGKGSASVFTRVSYYYDFIMQAAQDDSICVV